MSHNIFLTPAKTLHLSEPTITFLEPILAPPVERFFPTAGLDRGYSWVIGTHICMSTCGIGSLENTNEDLSAQVLASYVFLCLNLEWRAFHLIVSVIRITALLKRARQSFLSDISELLFPKIELIPPFLAEKSRLP